MLSCICIQQYAAMHCLFLQSRSQHFSCFFATNRMIYSANHPVYLYQLVATDLICWLPVNELNFFLTEWTLMTSDKGSSKEE
jgi:hypothetical protein